MVFLLPSGCNDEVVGLSRQNKIKADSIFREQEKELKIEMDSICKDNYKATFDIAVDSIAAIRIREIEEINKR